MNVLIVEDDVIIADTMRMTLSQSGYHSIHAMTIESALNEIAHTKFDAVLLDINLPDGDGTRLTCMIRRGKFPAPILVVSGNSTVDDRINALGSGADGYLTKPFDKDELMAHLEAIIRRANGHSSASLDIGNLRVDLNRNLVTIDDKFVPLTHKEFQIICLLAMRKGSVLSKHSFISNIYGGIDEPDSKIVDVFICKLRHKLAKFGLEGAKVETIWGQGYMLTEDNIDEEQDEHIAMNMMPQIAIGIN